MTIRGGVQRFFFQEVSKHVPDGEEDQDSGENECAGVQFSVENYTLSINFDNFNSSATGANASLLCSCEMTQLLS